MSDGAPNRVRPSPGEARRTIKANDISRNDTQHRRKHRLASRRPIQIKQREVLFFKCLVCCTDCVLLFIHLYRFFIFARLPFCSSRINDVDTPSEMRKINF